MIYTCTLNPSLDYYMEYDNLTIGKLNRSACEYFVPGGKGINVSIVLNNLNIPTRALGFLGGFTQEYFIEKLHSYEYIKPSFTYIAETTRINIKILSENETTLNAIGPNISDNEKNQMLKRFANMNSNDILVLSGSIPSSCTDLVDTMMKKCEENNVKIVLDTVPSVMKSLLKYKPLLVKPNKNELEEMFNVTIKNNDDIIKYAKEVVSLGACNCIVTMGFEGSYLCNKDGIYHSNVAKGKVRSTTGSGDSVVAGFLMNYLRSRDYAAMFKYASACGSATAFSKGLATKSETEALLDEIIITKVD